MLPYVICGGLAVLTGLLAWQRLRHISTPFAGAQKPANATSAQK
jgi:hypothetical protein